MNHPITFSPELTTDDPCAMYWLRQVTVRLRREITWLRHERGVDSGASEVLPPFVDPVQEALDLTRFQSKKAQFYETNVTARYLSDMLEEPLPSIDFQPPRGSFSWVVRHLQLDAASQFLLALGLAPVFDRSISTVIAACQNTPHHTLPRLALAQQLWDAPEHMLSVLNPQHPLFRYGLLVYMQDQAAPASSIGWDTPITSMPLIAQALLYPEMHRPQGLAHVSSTEKLSGEEEAALVTAIAALKSHEAQAMRVVPLLGAAGDDYASVLNAIADYTGRPVLRINADARHAGLATFVHACCVYAWLKQNDLYLEQEMIDEIVQDKPVALRAVLPDLSIPATIYIGVSSRKQASGIPRRNVHPVLNVPSFTHATRLAYWKKCIGTRLAGPEHVLDRLAHRFRYPKGTIDAIVEGLQGFEGPLTEDRLVAACQTHLDVDIGELAQRVSPRFAGEELILPPQQANQFDELLNGMRSLTEVHYGWGTAKAWNESGITALFAGPPGTGKTMGAEVIASKLKMPMYRIDLSQVVNKYIGETEKNLKKLFDAADNADVILFFDEADAIFGQRTEVKDAHDRYANLEVSYLLERMERFKGLAILATNRKKDLDEAFMRRIRYLIEFPLPDVLQRERIWKQAIPDGVDLSGVDLDFLARQFPLAGGHIRSIVLSACLQCAVPEGSSHNGRARRLTMEAVITAIKREYDKLNRNVSLAQFGPFANLVEQLDK